MRPKHYLNEKAEINSETTSDTESVKIGQYIKDPLFRNSLFIILASALGGAFGFIFWVLAANSVALLTGNAFIALRKAECLQTTGKESGDGCRDRDFVRYEATNGTQIENKPGVLRPL